MDDVTSRIEKELERIGAALRAQRKALPPNGDDSGLPRSYHELYAAQQALSWALEPEGFKSPYASSITSTSDSRRDSEALADLWASAEPYRD